MPKEHTITSYEFDELSSKAKEKARDWFREGALDYDWWDATYDDAKRSGLKISGFDLDNNYPSIDAKLVTNAHVSAKAIIADHGKETATYKIAKRFLETASNDPGEEDREDQEYLSELKDAYLKILTDEAEYLTSDESVDESIRANEYEFYKDGERFVV